MHDLLLLRATPALGRGADVVALAPFDAALAHRVLRARQRHDLAARLEHALSTEEGAALASALYSYVNRETRTGFFHSYRKLLPDDEAQALVYLAGWLWRAAQAGCGITPTHAARTPAGLPVEDPAPVPRAPAHAMSLPTVPGHASAQEESASDQDDAGGIMPPWLDAPGHSVWSDGPPALPGP